MALLGQTSEIPDTKIILSEGGIGWIPYILERSEHVATQYRYLRGRNWGTDPETGVMHPIETDVAQFPISPRELFRQHMFGCFIEDEFGAAKFELYWDRQCDDRN